MGVVTGCNLQLRDWLGVNKNCWQMECLQYYCWLDAGSSVGGTVVCLVAAGADCGINGWVRSVWWMAGWVSKEYTVAERAKNNYCLRATDHIHSHHKAISPASRNQARFLTPWLTADYLLPNTVISSYHFHKPLLLRRLPTISALPFPFSASFLIHLHSSSPSLSHIHRISLSC